MPLVRRDVRPRPADWDNPVVLSAPSASNLTQLPHPVRLPDLLGPGLQRRQPAAPVAEGVDALEVAQVEDLPALLGRVAHDGRPARLVRAGGRLPERLPAEHAD